jgi:uncharacterized membrane protein
MRTVNTARKVAADFRACAGRELRANLNRGSGMTPLALEAQFGVIASYIALVIEAGAVLVVTFGAIQALSAVVATAVSRGASEMQGREIWLRFATWILLGLEFALAADLVRTAVAPTWDDISKLAVIATIRTMLNYFLAKDIADFSEARGLSENPPSA